MALKKSPKSKKWSESVIPIFHPLGVALKTRSKFKQMVRKYNTYYPFLPKKKAQIEQNVIIVFIVS